MNLFLRFCFVLLSLSFSSFYLVKNHLTPPPPPPPLPKVSGFHLTQAWPATYCHLNSHCCNLTVLLNNVNFTIHGLWPFDSSENSLTGCTGSDFKNSFVKGIQSDLDKAWPSLNTAKSNVVFWKHEWIKHGKCSETILVGADYFKTTFKLRNTFNILGILAKEGIIPDDNRYELQLIRNAIHDATGFDVKLFCVKFDILEGIGLCIDPSTTTFVSCVDPGKSCQKNDAQFLSIASVAARILKTTGEPKVELK